MTDSTTSSTVAATNAATTISGSSTFTLTMGQFLSLLGVLGAGAISVVGAMAYQTGLVREELKSVRTAVENSQKDVHTFDKDAVSRLRDAEKVLADQIGALRGDLAGLRSDLSVTTKSIAVLSAQLGDIQKQGYLNSASFSDPKVMESFVENLKTHIGDSKVVILPVPSTIRGQPR